MAHPAFTQSVHELTLNRIKSINHSETGDAKHCALFFLLSDYAEFVGVNRRYILMVSSLRASSQQHAKCVSILRGFIAGKACSDLRVLRAAV